MFLSAVDINPQRREARKLLGSPQVMHAAVLASFPPVAHSERSRILWRLDKADHHSRLYLVSAAKPDLTHVVEQAGWMTSPQQTGDYGRFLESLGDGQEWAFRLTANPTHAVRSPEGRSRRMGHVTVDQQIAWLLSRASDRGFEVVHKGEGEVNLLVRERAVVQFRRGSGQVTLSKATFDGQLRIVDVNRFRNTLVSGIGPSKAYGCGLMTLDFATGSS